MYLKFAKPAGSICIIYLQFLNILFSFFHFQPYFQGGTWWCSWSKQRATSRKVAVSITNCVTGIFTDVNDPALLWSGVDAASNRNKYQEYFLEGKGAGA